MGECFICCDLRVQGRTSAKSVEHGRTAENREVEKIPLTGVQRKNPAGESWNRRAHWQTMDWGSPRSASVE